MSFELFPSLSSLFLSIPTNKHTMDPIVLYENEFAWVLHNETGAVVVVEGPARVVLRPDETMIQKSIKVLLKENYYCILINPFDKERDDYAMGTREVREGPREFCLYPRERMDGGVRQAHVIRAEQSIILLAKRDDAFSQTKSNVLHVGPNRRRCIKAPSPSIGSVRTAYFLDVLSDILRKRERDWMQVIKELAIETTIHPVIDVQCQTVALSNHTSKQCEDRSGNVPARFCHDECTLVFWEESVTCCVDGR